MADMPVVLDTSALLATLQNEPGKERVDAALLDESCYLSSVNLAEFATKCLGGGMSRPDLNAVLAGFDFEIVPFDRALALATGALRTPTRHLGLSLGDRACLALAQHLNATALTADRPWVKLDLGISIECIRDRVHP
jgi:PIN domain nuclease of toxin-antitoxin system